MNIEREQQYLGCLFLMAFRDMGSDEVARQCTGLEPSDFANHQNRAIFNAIKSRSERGMAFDTTLISDDCADSVDFNYLFEIAKNGVSTANTAEYKGLIKRDSLKRQALAATNHMAELISQSEDPIQALGESESIIHRLMGRANDENSGFVHISQMMNEYIDEIEQRLANPEKLTGQKTGMACMDAMLEDGIQPGSLIVMGGRPAMGKTAMMLSLIKGMTESGGGKSTVVYSLEMGLQQLMKRYAGFYTGKTYNAMMEEIKRDPDGVIWGKLAQMAHQNKDLPIYMKDTSSLTVEQVCVDARKRHRDSPIGLIAIDYLTLMKKPKAERNDLSVGEITRSLKNLAKELGCTVLLLSQLNRAVEQRPNKRPLPSDFRDSGSIEQDADYIITLYRDVVYNEESVMANIGEVDWSKVRHGDTFRSFVEFTGGSWVDAVDQDYAKGLMREASQPKRREYGGGGI